MRAITFQHPVITIVILILLEAQSFVPFAVSKNMQKVQLTFSVRTIVAFIHCFKLQITALFIISTNRICQVQVDPNYMHFQLDADQLNGQQEDSESETDSDESDGVLPSRVLQWSMVWAVRGVRNKTAHCIS